MHPNHANPASELGIERLTGKVSFVTFCAADTGFHVLKAKDVEGKKAVVTGTCAVGLREGETFEAFGRWEKHPKHGPQFVAEALHPSLPESQDGALVYLESGMVPGITPRMAKKLIKKYGPDVFRVLDEEPEKLLELWGIGKKKLDKIVAGWAAQRNVKHVMEFLLQHDIPQKKAVRIYRAFKEQTIAKVKQNPYCLAREVRGITFELADRIALSLGVSHDSPLRAGAGLTYALQGFANQGHCAMDEDRVLRSSQKLLDIPEEVLAAAVDHEVKARQIRRIEHEGRRLLALPYLHESERGIAFEISRLAAEPSPWKGKDIPETVRQAEKQCGILLSPAQRDGVTQALMEKVSVITGGPGVGKTASIQVLLAAAEILEATSFLCAPTGRAAKRMEESTGHEARTIHRTLSVDHSQGGFLHNEHFPLAGDLVVADEWSMPDAVLAYSLLKAVRSDAHLVLVGDVDQIASVGPGMVLGDMIQSGAVATAFLTEIFRQAAGSRIVTNSHRLNSGQMPELSPKGAETDFYMVDCGDPRRVIDLVVKAATERVPEKFGFDPARDIQVIAPTKKGDLGTRALNEALQRAINPAPASSIVRTEDGHTLRYGIGDRVIQNVNNYDLEVFNGEVGFIVKADSKGGELVVDFEGREVTYGSSEISQLALAYALTNHKTQGGEYPAVIHLCSWLHRPLLERNILYTGFSRAQKLLMVIGETEALREAVNTQNSRRRITMLQKHLQERFPQHRAQQPHPHTAPGPARQVFLAGAENW